MSDMNAPLDKSQLPQTNLRNALIQVHRTVHKSECNKPTTVVGRLLTTFAGRSEIFLGPEFR